MCNIFSSQLQRDSLFFRQSCKLSLNLNLLSLACATVFYLQSRRFRSAFWRAAEQSHAFVHFTIIKICCRDPLFSLVWLSNCAWLVNQSSSSRKLIAPTLAPLDRSALIPSGNKSRNRAPDHFNC